MKADKLLTLARCGHDKFTTAADFLQSPLLLLTRLYWGWSFYGTGSVKLRNFDATVVNFRDKFHLPAPVLNAALACTAECVCGILLMLGLASRLASVPLVVTMIVAYVTTENLTADPDHPGAVLSVFKGGLPTILDNLVTATPFPFLFASLLVLAFGPGAFSLDRLIARKFGTAPATR